MRNARERKRKPACIQHVARLRQEEASQLSTRSVASQYAVLLTSYFFSFLRAAQYFFIRSDTALRAAADMLLRRLRVAAGAPISRADALRPRPLNRSGKAPRMANSSRRNSSRRALAPSRANRCISSRVKSATYPPKANGLATPANSWSTNPKRVLIRSKGEECLFHGSRAIAVLLTSNFLLSRGPHQ